MCFGKFCFFSMQIAVFGVLMLVAKRATAVFESGVSSMFSFSHSFCSCRKHHRDRSKISGPQKS